MRMILICSNLEISGMFVCICNSVTDREIREAAKNGANTLEALSQKLKVATCCGRCADQAKAQKQQPGEGNYFIYWIS